GSDRLDFTYIDDLVQGLVKVVANEESKNQIFNLTFGFSQSISEMVEILTEHFPGVKVHFLPKDDLMPDRGTLSVDKARALLGYEPSWSLKSGFPKYIDWYKELFRDIKNTGKINLLF
ncbi:MAG: NAD(P)-dependent oxidoreductase, partial [Deltaproteobacteria bacterium]|nr:NAD(P)-dependent oxidoreductase [Deltaproteobacteria bacterium]